MTTIATDGRSMAGDGIAIINGVIVDTEAVKVCKLADGSLFGACGVASDADRLIDWMNAGSKGDWPKRSDNFGAIVLRPSGEIFTCAESDGLVPSRAPLAMGSGMDFAIGAMDAGYSAADAVAVAIRRDPHTAGTITELTLETGNG